MMINFLGTVLWLYSIWILIFLTKKLYALQIVMMIEC